MVLISNSGLILQSTFILAAKNEDSPGKFCLVLRVPATNWAFSMAAGVQIIDFRMIMKQNSYSPVFRTQQSKDNNRSYLSKSYHFEVKLEIS